MDGKICYFWMAISMQWKLAHWIPTFISGEVSEDVAFIHKTFLPGPVAKRVTIEYNVSFYYRTYLGYLILGIYTTQDQVNLEKNCTYKDYGQVGKTAMHQDLGSWHTHCERRENNTLHCAGNITVQDFIRRKFSISFGFHCHGVTSTSRLKGLTYNISIYPQTEGVTYFPSHWGLYLSQLLRVWRISQSVG